MHARNFNSNRGFCIEVTADAAGVVANANKSATRGPLTRRDGRDRPVQSGLHDFVSLLGCGRVEKRDLAQPPKNNNRQ